MLIIPAIDIKDGCVVRFTQGRLDKKVYSKDPLKTAKHWVRQGAKLIHVVDLDGAAAGEPKNLEALRQILKNIDVPVEFGGGVRDLRTIERLLRYGVYRVVLGTKAIEDANFLKKAFKKFKDKVIISLDLKGTDILIKGWQSRHPGKEALRFMHGLRKLGFKQIIYTDTLKDGTLKGPNIKEIKRLLRESGMKIIASGGIASLDDIYRLKLLERHGLVGVIVGKALYEGKFTLSEALQLA